MAKFVAVVSLFLLLQASLTVAYHGSTNNFAMVSSKRRSLLTSVGIAAAAAFSPLLQPALAAAAPEDGGVEVYFGVGCYWHIQHEFVEAERSILGRNDRTLTSRTGYAGGTKLGTSDRLVCYHNYQGIADYSKLGHAEVVGMNIPEGSIEAFAKVYFGLFNPETGERVDPQDKGPEYRSLIGLPGGIRHPKYAAVIAAGLEQGFRVQVGKGNDGDTLHKNKLVYIYDSDKFPFHQAEVYMQFRDDFQSAPYGKEYNNLVEMALEDGRVVGQGCPDTY